MNYRYTGSGFIVNVKAGETAADSVKRLLAEQPTTDRPSMQVLNAQVRLVHAIEDIVVANDVAEIREALVTALRELAAHTHGLKVV